jgi:glycosyltransferase involved in cell wall biosynthesis
MIKIYDSSNSKKRPLNRGFGGVVENENVFDIKEYLKLNNFIILSSPENADIIFTNDIFYYEEEYLPNLYPNKIYIKRMDGIFFQNDLKYRNELLNQSACDANIVSFISEFSKNSLKGLYPELKIKNSIVINNFTNPNFFKKKEFFNNKPLNALIIATDWKREEKRLNDILKLKNILIENNITLHIIGTLDEKINDIKYISYGYIKEKEIINEIYNKCDFLINLSYKDACPKTVCNAINCGLPVFYANSGGVSEIVKENFGSYTNDNLNIMFEEKIPELKQKILEKDFQLFLNNYELYQQNLITYLDKKENFIDFKKMLKKYQEIFSTIS